MSLCVGSYTKRQLKFVEFKRIMVLDRAVIANYESWFHIALGFHSIASANVTTSPHDVVPRTWYSRQTWIYKQKYPFFVRDMLLSLSVSQCIRSKTLCKGQHWDQSIEASIYVINKTERERARERERELRPKKDEIKMALESGITRSFINCTLAQILLEREDEGGRDRQGI